jgi:hypothetical protein
MNDKNIYVISTNALLAALNNNRKKNNFPEIDHPLIASKLGILFALKTNGYVNFKGEYVELKDAQLIALQEILDQHFNANMTAELRAMVITQDQMEEKMAADVRHLTSSTASQASLLGKLKGFFKTKSKVQERHA